jgi:hypothetical protein
MDALYIKVALPDVNGASLSRRLPHQWPKPAELGADTFINGARVGGSFIKWVAKNGWWLDWRIYADPESGL